MNETRPHPLGQFGAGGQTLVEDEEPTTTAAPVGPAPAFDSEPVRLLLRPVLVALLALVTAYGLVDDTVAPAWLALVDALLAVGGWVLIERVRANVYSRQGAKRKADRAARAAAAAGRDAWASTVSTETTSYRLGPL